MQSLFAYRPGGRHQACALGLCSGWDVPFHVSPGCHRQGTSLPVPLPLSLSEAMGRARPEEPQPLSSQDLSPCCSGPAWKEQNPSSEERFVGPTSPHLSSGIAGNKLLLPKSPGVGATVRPAQDKAWCEAQSKYWLCSCWRQGKGLSLLA